MNISIYCKLDIISTEKDITFSNSIDTLYVKNLTVQNTSTLDEFLSLIILEINGELKDDKVTQFTIDDFDYANTVKKSEKMHFDKLFADASEVLITVKYLNNSIEPDIITTPLETVDDIVDNISDDVEGIDDINDLVKKFLSNDAKDEIAAASKELSDDDKKTLSDIILAISPSTKSNTQRLNKSKKTIDKPKQDTDKLDKDNQNKNKVSRRQKYITSIKQLDIDNIPQLF